MIEVEVGDTIVEFPDGTPNEVIQRALQQQFGAPKPTQPTYDWEKPGGATAGFWENAVAGVGKEMTDAGLGIRQMLEIGDPEALRQEALDKQKLDAELASSGGGMAGQAATIVGTALIPGAGVARFGTAIPAALRAGASILGGAAGGAASGALEPTTKEGQRETNMQYGAVLGAVPFSKVGGKILDRMPVTGSLRKSARAEEARAAIEARQELRQIGIDARQAERDFAKAQAAAARLAKAEASAAEQAAARQALEESAQKVSMLRKLEERAGTMVARADKALPTGPAEALNPIERQAAARQALEESAQKVSMLRKLEERASTTVARADEALPTGPAEALNPIERQAQINVLREGEGTVTEGAEALLRKGKAAYIKESRRLGQQYRKVESPREGTGRVNVKVTAPDDLAGELSSSSNPVLRRLAGITEGGKDYTLRDVREAQRLLKEKAFKGANQNAYKDALKQLDDALESWGQGSEAAGKQLAESRAVDKVFKENIGSARPEFGVRGAGKNATFPKLESVVAALRNPKTSGAFAKRVQGRLPEATPELRRVLGVLAKENPKALESDMAKQLLSPEELKLVESVLQNLD